MPEPKFKSGDIVRFNSGGIKLVVHSPLEEEDGYRYFLVWWNAEALAIEGATKGSMYSLKEESLTLVQRNTKEYLDFKVGDVVKLKCGSGPKFTVAKFSDSSEAFVLVWCKDEFSPPKLLINMPTEAFDLA